MAAQRTLEVRSWADSECYYLSLSGHYKMLLGLPIPLRIHDHLIQARDSYMPKTMYDRQGSQIRFFSPDYARITHATKRTASEEVEVVPREEVSDCLLADGWTLMGFAACPGINPENMTIAEKWSKKLDFDAKGKQ